MKEILMMSLTTSCIVGVVWFFIKQAIWTRYLLPLVCHKSKPIITFNDGTGVMSITADTSFNAEEEIKKQIDKERNLMPEAHIQNPYDNPWVMFQQSPENYRIYNYQRDLYLKYKERQIRNLVTEEFERVSLVPIRLVVKNKGKTPTGKCNIEINFSNDTVVFGSNSFVECVDCIMNKPMLAKGHSFPCLNWGKAEYKYRKLDKALHIESPIRLTMDCLNQCITNNDTIPIFYVDSRMISKLNIYWKIVDPLHQNPMTGELTLNINRD